MRRTRAPLGLLLFLALGVLFSACNGSTGSGGSGAGDSVGKPFSCASEQTHTGQGTFYSADGTGNCGFDKSADLMVAAMNHTDYAGSAVCGECVAITGPDRKSVV